jgi:glycosyltransferase involved in cell wall biosynthesis
VSEAILRLLHDPEERQRLGKAAKETIDKGYTLDTMCSQFEKLLTDKVKERS